MTVVLAQSLEWNTMPDEAALQQARVRHRLRRADRYTSLCICATDALLEERPPSPETALITVSSFGPSATSFQTVEEILAEFFCRAFLNERTILNFIQHFYI